MSVNAIAADWATCKRCHLHRTRRKVVVGEGIATGDGPLLLIVGEAPGRSEDATGRPFVGPSGEILRNDLLPEAGVRLAYITNVLGCRPPGNRDPEPYEIEACAPRLAAIVDALKPDGLLTVGRISTGTVDHPWRKALEDRPESSILHPASLLRAGYPNAATRRKLQVQVAKVRRLLARLGATSSLVPVCGHVFSQAGHWRYPDGMLEPFRACVLCGTLEA